MPRHIAFPSRLDSRSFWLRGKARLASVPARILLTTVVDAETIILIVVSIVTTSCSSIRTTCLTALDQTSLVPVDTRPSSATLEGEGWGPEHVQTVQEF